LLAELERELRLARLRVQRLEEQATAARQLTQALTEARAKSISNQSSVDVSSVQMLRAKNVGDLALQFLRDRVPGATVLELYSALTRTGLPVGRSEYLYTVVKKLVRKRLIRMEKNGTTKRYFVIDASPDLALKAPDESKLRAKKGQNEAGPL